MQDSLHNLGIITVVSSVSWVCCEGQKYEFAVKWKINVVNPRWLNDSVKAGYSLPEASYHVNSSAASHSGVTTSTPTNDSGLLCDTSISLSVLSHLLDGSIVCQCPTAIGGGILLCRLIPCFVPLFQLMCFSLIDTKNRQIYANYGYLIAVLVGWLSGHVSVFGSGCVFDKKATNSHINQHMYFLIVIFNTSYGIHLGAFQQLFDLVTCSYLWFLAFISDYKFIHESVY